MKTLTIGRSSDNDYCIDDQYAGRHHCHLILDDNGEVHIIDLKSKNGTFVNGTRIEVDCVLHKGDTVKIGNTDIDWESFFVEPKAQRQTPPPLPKRPVDNPKPPQKSQTPPPTRSVSPPHPPLKSQPHSLPTPPPVPAPVTKIQRSLQPQPIHEYASLSVFNCSRVIIFVAGLMSFSFILYIVFHYLASMQGQIISRFVGEGNYVGFFPVYLHGFSGYGGQWFLMISAVALGAVADFVDGIIGTIKGSKLASAGMCMANISVFVGAAFLLMALFAPLLLKI